MRQARHETPILADYNIGSSKDLLEYYFLEHDHCSQYGDVWSKWSAITFIYYTQKNKEKKK